MSTETAPAVAPHERRTLRRPAVDRKMDLQPLQRFEIRGLIYFVALAEELHLARAAERVGIQESPMSRAISTMERKLGVRLFARSSKGTRLTSTGQALLPLARQMLDDAEQAYRVVHAAATGCKGQLRVALCELVTSPRVAELMRQSRTDDAEIHFSFEQYSLSDQVARLRSGMIDIGLTASISDEPTGIDADVDVMVMSRDPLMMALPARHALAEQAVIRELRADLGPFVLVDCCPTDADRIRELVEHSCGAAPQIEFVTSLGLLLTKVAAGEGVGLVSAAQAQDIARPDITFRPLEPRCARMTTFLLKRQGEESVIVTRFIQRARRLHVRP